jgi:hypothetical protein
MNPSIKSTSRLAFSAGLRDLLDAAGFAVSSGYTTATITNCKIGVVRATLRHFGPQSLKRRCTPCVFRDELSRHNRPFKHDLQRQSSASDQLDRHAKIGA